MRGGWWILGFVFPQTNDTPLSTLQWVGWSTEKCWQAADLGTETRGYSCLCVYKKNCSVQLWSSGFNLEMPPRSLCRKSSACSLFGCWKIQEEWHVLSALMLHYAKIKIYTSKILVMNIYSTKISWNIVTKLLPNPVRGEYTVNFHPLHRNPHIQYMTFNLLLCCFLLNIKMQTGLVFTLLNSYILNKTASLRVEPVIIHATRRKGQT